MRSNQIIEILEVLWFILMNSRYEGGDPGIGIDPSKDYLYTVL